MTSVTSIRVATVAISLLLAACFAESGLRDELGQATDALDDLIGEVEDGPIREAADRAVEAVGDARAALDDFRENPTTETRRALEDVERRVNEARDTLERLLERAPEGLREAVGDVVDALEEVRREIRRELDD